MVNLILQGVPPLHSEAILDLQQIALSTLADKTVLQHINTELVEKQKRQRCGKEKTSFRKARVLSVEEALEKLQQKEQKEQEEAAQKKRHGALQGVIMFTKKV